MAAKSKWEPFETELAYRTFVRGFREGFTACASYSGGEQGEKDCEKSLRYALKVMRDERKKDAEFVKARLAGKI